MDLSTDLLNLLLKKLNNKDWLSFRLTSKKVYYSVSYKECYERLKIAHKKQEIRFLEEILEMNLRDVPFIINKI